MKKFEYHQVFLSPHATEREAILSRMGEKGWELCCIDGFGIAIFKRECS